MVQEVILNTWDAVRASLIKVVQEVIEAVPNVVAALVILIVGYLFAWLIHWAVKSGLDKIKFDDYVVKKTELKNLLGSFALGNSLAVLAKWYVLILFWGQAAVILNPSMGWLAGLLEAAAKVSIPNLILGIIVALLGLLAGDYIHSAILATKAKSAKVVADSTRLIVWVFTLLIVLAQVGVRISLAEQSLLLILAGIMLALGLALGLGFGLALKEHANEMIKAWKKRL